MIIELRERFLKIERKAICQQPLIAAFRADFECSCFTYEGIDAVKEALRAGAVIPQLCQLNNIISGIAAGNPEIPIRINLIAPPVYVMTCSTPDKADGLAVLTEGCKVECLEEFSTLLVITLTLCRQLKRRSRALAATLSCRWLPRQYRLFMLFMSMII